MSRSIIRVENLSKLYRLGEVGTGTLSHDLNRWWARIRRKEDPYARVGTVNDRTQEARKGEHVWALNDINFEVNQGEVVGIIGRNGAGKSTLLKILSRVTSPTKGYVRVNGRIASLLEVGTGFHPELTGRENIYLNGTIMGMNRHEIKRKIDEIVDFAGVAKYLDTPTKRYSSGMTVRLGFAVAAFLEPEILVVDEVLAVGDVDFQKKAVGKMQDVSRGEGRTVLFVSHNMGSIRSLCGSCILLSNGTIEHIGQTNETIKKYLEQSPSLIRSLEINEDGGEGFNLNSVKIMDSKGDISRRFSSEDEIVIEIKYTLKSTIRRLRINMVLKNHEGIEIFHSSDLASAIEPVREPGTYASTCVLPKHFFNASQYTICIGADIPLEKMLFEDRDVLTFEIEELKYNQTVYSVSGKPLGLLHPKLDWNVRKDSQD